jgi:hypothetical protein
MEKQRNGQTRRVIGKPFVKGDPRINRRGTPKSFEQLRKLAQSIGAELVTDGQGRKLTVAEAVLRKLASSGDPQANRIFLEYGFGRPPDKIETTGLENKTLILHFGHEKDRVERELLLRDDDCK